MSMGILHDPTNGPLDGGTQTQTVRRAHPGDEVAALGHQDLVESPDSCDPTCECPRCRALAQRLQHAMPGLAGELTTIRVCDRYMPDGVRDVQAVTVAPGLGVTPNTGDGDGPVRYDLIHLPSGRAVAGGHCSEHLQVAVQVAIDSGLNWTSDKDTVIAAAGQIDLPGQLRPLRCRTWCDGDGPKPASWGVRCATCGWQWDHEDHDGPLTVDDARRIGDDHQCEPAVELQPPVADDSTILAGDRR